MNNKWRLFIAADIIVLAVLAVVFLVPRGRGATSMAMLVTQPVFDVSGTVKQINNNSLVLEATFKTTVQKQVKQTLRIAIKPETQINQQKERVTLLKPISTDTAAPTTPDNATTRTKADIKTGMYVKLYVKEDMRTINPLTDTLTATNIQLPKFKNNTYVRIKKINKNTFTAQPVESIEGLYPTYTVYLGSATEISQLDFKTGKPIFYTPQDLEENRIYVVSSQEDALITQNLTALRIEVLPKTPTAQSTTLNL